MRIAVYVPLFAAAVLGLGGPALGRLLPPSTAVRGLTIAGVLASLASSFSLAVLAWTLIGQWEPVAALGHWSVARLRGSDPVPHPTALAALSLLPPLALLLGRSSWRSAGGWLAARRLCRQLGGAPGQLLVIGAAGSDAFALAADGGRIVISRELLAALAPVERRVLLAHEAAHLRHHHAAYRIGAELAAALNPLLRPLARAVAYGCERWADEDSATVVSRGDAARTVARAALLGTPGGGRGDSSSLVLRVHGSTSVNRVRALLAPAPRRRPAAVALLVAVVLTVLTTTAEAGHDTEVLFEHAGSRTAVSGA